MKFKPVEVPKLRAALVHAAIVYDSREAKKRFYNPYAFSHYMSSINDVMELIEDGSSVRGAIFRRFNDRLLDHMLKAAGQPKAAIEEIRERDAVYFRELGL